MTHSHIINISYKIDNEINEAKKNYIYYSQLIYC